MEYLWASPGDFFCIACLRRVKHYLCILCATWTPQNHNWLQFLSKNFSIISFCSCASCSEGQAFSISNPDDVHGRNLGLLTTHWSIVAFRVLFSVLSTLCPTAIPHLITLSKCLFKPPSQSLRAQNHYQVLAIKSLFNPSPNPLTPHVCHWLHC